MRKLFLMISILFLTINSCTAQKKTSLNEAQKIKLVERDKFINEIALMLNDYDNSNCQDIPGFFKEYDFDQKRGSKYWLSMHAAVSLRKLIIDKLDNRLLLDCIIKSDNEYLKKSNPLPKNAPFSYNKIPYQEYSTYELVKLRIEELENLQKLGQ